MSIDEIRASDFGDVSQDREDPEWWLVREPSNPKDVAQVRFCVTPEEGLLKIAFVWIIETNVYGDSVQKKFNELHDILAKKYGKGEKLDYLKSDSIWNEPKDWMMGLLKEERVLVWIQRDFADSNKWNLNTIGLQAKALRRDQGGLMLQYEFQGFSEYLKKKEAEEASQF